MKLACLALVVLLAMLADARRRKPTKYRDYSCSEVSDDENTDYADFMDCHYRNYMVDGKNAKRMSNFRRCRSSAEEHDPDASGFAIGMTKFCYWTDDEFQQSLNPELANYDTDDDAAVHTYERSFDERQTPVNFSWIDRGAVSAVKDQGSCGSCYAFAAAGALEGAHQIKYGRLYNLSTQQYTDCSANYTAVTSTSTCSGKNCKPVSTEKWYLSTSGNKGCNGGMYTNCWAYNNMTGHGQGSYTCYPYTSGTSKKPGKCAYNGLCDVKVPVKNYTRIAKNDEVGLLSAVATVGPVACAIDASKLSSYTGGVFNGTSSTVNHAILVVGYGTSGTGAKYWLVKNSWGTKWGIKGYFLLARGSNAIQIARSCAYPNV